MRCMRSSQLQQPGLDGTVISTLSIPKAVETTALQWYACHANDTSGYLCHMSATIGIQPEYSQGALSAHADSLQLISRIA